MLPDKGFTGISPRAAPSNFSVTPDPASLPTPWIGPRPDPRWHPSLILSKQLSRDAHTQSFMGALVIVMPQPLCAASLLSGQSVVCVADHFGLINSMKLPVRSVLARPSRCGKFHLNP
jgi:hypothetical protein